ncbi:MAG: lipid A biosynthesis acyltransferase, partial [Gammaproteobacteria bacterium]|nr:lipid A biosynthesis acyltransferase [Gammaproteobacteria bacterium]
MALPLNNPSNWPALLALALIRMTVALPHRLRLAIGRGAGRLAMRVMRKRRAIALRNLQLCFPE